MATAPYPFPYPSAATYPPPLPSGGYYPSPVPYNFSSYGAPPAFPYAATYPYPPPASAYTAAAAFSPAPAYGPTTAPPATALPPHPEQVPGHPLLTETPTLNPPACSHLPYSHLLAPPLQTTAPTTTQSLVSASSEFYGALSLRSSLCGRPMLLQHKEGGCETEEDDGATPRCDRTFSDKVVHFAMPKFRCRGGDLTKGTNTSGASINDEKLVHKQPGPEILSLDNNDSNLSCAMHKAQTESSFDSLHGAISKLSTLVSQFAVSLGKQSTSEQPQHISIVPAAPAHVAPQVFAEMATPFPWKGTHGTAPDYCFGHHNSIQSSCVTKSIEQNPDASPQPYGFRNLNRQSVLLADGTEHNYFTLPSDYPLERVVPEPVFHAYDDETDDCPNAFVDVSASTPEQQPYEDRQHESRQAPKCFSTPTFSGSVGPFSFTEEKKSENEQLAVCFNNASNNALSERATDLTCPQAHVIQADRFIKLTNEKSNQATSTLCLHEVIVHCHEERPEHINCTNDLETVQLNFEQEDILISGAMSNVVNSTAWEFVAAPSHCINRAELKLLWDPGASLPHISIKKQQPDKALRPAIHASTLVDNFEKFHGHENVALIAGSSATGFSGYECLSLWTQNNIYVCWKSEIGPTTYISWDPGVLSIIEDMMLDKYSVSHQVQLVQLKTECFFLSSTACIQFIAANDINTVLHATCFRLRRTAHLTQELSAWPNQSVHISASYIWDPGTVLWFISLSLATVIENTYAYYLTVKHFDGRSIHYPESIRCYFMVNTVMEEKKMVTRLSPTFWSSIQQMQYYDYFQNWNALSFQQYSHEDMNLCEIPLWLINFLVP